MARRVTVQVKVWKCAALRLPTRNLSVRKLTN
jgi:hypothetical protein